MQCIHRSVWISERRHRQRSEVAIIAEIIEVKEQEETDLWIFQRNYACADCSGTRIRKRR